MSIIMKVGNVNMKFDFAIGNPPYHEEARGNNASDTPVYHLFIDEANKVSRISEFITPARFLFNAGGTPAVWNEKMLNDEHFKVMLYEDKSSNVFPGTDIKGGVAVTYHDQEKQFGSIDIFTPYSELNSIRKKVTNISKASLVEVITNRGLYKYSELAYEEQPELMKMTADRRIAPSCFERMPSLFTEQKPNDSNQYIRILGRANNDRVYRWFMKKYVMDVSNLDKYKVIVAKANGTGLFGEVLANPFVEEPGVGFTETYISINETADLCEAEATLKYVKTKFLRTMLGILKVTQNNAKPTWKYVPLQDFTPSSDIDWSKSIPEIDQQLYRKYELSQEEIDFIESHVKEMV